MPVRREAHVCSDWTADDSRPQHTPRRRRRRRRDAPGPREAGGDVLGGHGARGGEHVGAPEPLAAHRLLRRV